MFRLSLGLKMSFLDSNSNITTVILGLCTPLNFSGMSNKGALFGIKKIKDEEESYRGKSCLSLPLKMKK